MGGFDVKARGKHLFAEVNHVLHKFVVKGVALLKDIEGLDSCGGNHGRNGVGEEVRARTLAQHLNDLLPAGCEAAHSTAEGLSKGAGEDIYAAVALKLLCNSVAGSAHNACAMAFIYHHKGVVFFREVADLVHRSHVAVHGEHAVRHNDPVAAASRFLQLFLKVCHVCVGITEALGLAKTHAVNDGSMVERV